MRWFLLGLCLMVNSVSASAETVTVSRGQVFLGGNRIDAASIRCERETITVNDYVIFPRRRPDVRPAPVTAPVTRMQQLSETLFAHPEWTAEEAAAFYRQASDVVSNAWAEPTANMIWVQFKDRQHPTSIDRSLSTAAAPESTTVERFRLIVTTLEAGGQVYAGDDYTIYVPWQQSAEVSKRFSTPALRDARFARRFQAALRDMQQPRPLESYRHRR